MLDLILDYYNVIYDLKTVRLYNRTIHSTRAYSDRAYHYTKLRCYIYEDIRDGALY